MEREPEAARRQGTQVESEEDVDLHGITRMEIDTCKTTNEDVEIEAYSIKRVVLCEISLGERAVVLPKDINGLIITKCHYGTRQCLGHALSFCGNNNDMAKIEWLNIKECHALESLCCASPTCSFCFSVELVRLYLEELGSLEQLLAPSSAPSFYSPFICLKDLYISRCRTMRILITLELLEHLQNLEVIVVESCRSMEEIVGKNDCSSGRITITLPKVRTMQLRRLRELTSVFRGTMLCPSLKHFDALGCKKLSPPHIEIVEGYRLQMEKVSTGYSWTCDDQEEEEDENEDKGEED